MDKSGGDMEGLSEALKMLQEALDHVKELTGNSAQDQEDTVDESTADTQESEESPEAVTSSGPGTEGDDMKKASAIEAVRKMMG